MKYGYFLEDAELGKVKVYLGDKEADIFTQKDRNYLEGETRKRPLDLDLHIAIYVLEKEGLARDLLDDLKEWGRYNPVAGTRLSSLFYPPHLEGE